MMGFGSLHAAPLDALVRGWIRESAAGFCEVYRRVLRDAQRFADLYAMLAQEATRRGTPKVVAMRMAHSG
jgi:uncharacterized protein YukE